ncbi:MAG: peptide-methionine (S)-S-oxide reductase MsrA [Sphingomonadaceae bacterium]|nr:peptide-methionine (S)-S-oxide reductase MsrA [Sphingomonadaceae bacterium]
MYRRTLTFLGAAAIGFAAVAISQAPSFAETPAVHAPAPGLDEHPNATSETAVFAGGCFWGVQGVFSHVKGVQSAVSGYTGGTLANPGYEDVSTGSTGHAESVRVTFDPRQMSYGRLLQIYFSVVADPTELNRQGPDEGTQYRSALFPTSDAQRRVAAEYIAQLGKVHLWRRPIVTRIEPARAFYPAESHHQDFLALNPTYPYIAINDIPKVEALKRMFPENWRAQPVLVKG